MGSPGWRGSYHLIPLDPQVYAIPYVAFSSECFRWPVDHYGGDGNLDRRHDSCRLALAVRLLPVEVPPV